MTQHRLAGAVLALCALAGLAACGGDDDDATAQTAVQNDDDQASAEDDDTGAAVTEATSRPTIAEVNILTDFGDV